MLHQFFEIASDYIVNFYLFGEKRLVKSVKLLSISIKSINPIQTYPQITESYSCILEIFVVIKDLSINFLISF